MPEKDRVGIVVQARMDSTRLVGKVLRSVQGKPLLRRLYDRVRLSRRADTVVVAASVNPADQEIEDACRLWGIPAFRGPEKDLTGRLLGAARTFGLTALVRVTADNPLTDPEGIDRLIEIFEQEKPGLVHNAPERGYPHGTAAEIMAVGVLETYDRELVSPDDRELVFSIARSQPERWRSVEVNAPPEVFRPQYSLSVDYPEDLEFVSAIYAHFGGRDDVRLTEIIQFLDSNPSVGGRSSRLLGPPES
jgi:spore coat polysaccharide biosynthesis protein SpsF